MVDQITMENIVRGDFSFLRKELIAEMVRQVSLRAVDPPRFDEIFEHHMFGLIGKLSKRLETATQETEKAPAPGSTLSFPTSQRTEQRPGP